MRPPVFAIVTGNIRSIAEFKLILTRICHLRTTKKIDEVVFSTWHDEIDKFAGMRTSLAALGVTIVEDVLPVEVGMGHITVQQKSFWNGLGQCPKDSYVIKLRTDKIFQELFDMLPRMMELIPQSLAPVEAIGTFPLVNTNRIVASTSLSWPFRLQDIIFCGTKRDVLNLIGFGRLYDGLSFPNVIAAEQRWFSNPFLLIPIIREYFASINTHALPEAVNAIQRDNRALIAVPEFLIRLFITYYILFVKNFVSLQDPGFSDVDHQGRPQGRDTVVAHILKQVEKNLLRGGWEAAVEASTLYDLLERIIEGEWRESALDKRCCEELLAFEASAGHGQIFAFPKTTQSPAPKTIEQSSRAIAEALGAVADDTPSGQLKLPFHLLQRVAAGDAVNLRKEALALAKSHWRGTDMPQDRKQAIGWLKLAALSSEPQARLLLGLAYYYGVGIDRDLNQAVYWLVAAAVTLTKNMRAPRTIVAALSEGVLPAPGATLPVHLVDLIEYLLQFSNSHALFLFAELYESGRLVERDPVRARHLYGDAAALGHRQAAQRLEKMDQPPKRLRRVLSWIRAS